MFSTYQAQTSPPVVKVVASVSGVAKQRLRYRKSGIVWEISPGQVDPVVASANSKHEASGTGSVAQIESDSAAPRTAGFVETAGVVARSAPRQRRGAERRVSLDFKDAEIVNVLRFFSEVSGENIIASDDVKGKISIRLRNVPWEQALDTILHTKGYGKVRENNILRIAPSKMIQDERERELARRKAKEAVEPTAIKIITVNYAVASQVVDRLAPLLTERGSVQTDERTNTIIAEDVISNIDRLVELTRRLDRQTPQVLIEARIVEASSNHLKELGIQWGGTGQMTAAEGTSTGLQFPGDVVVSGAADTSSSPSSGTFSPARYAVNLPAAIGPGAGGGLGFIFGSAGGGQLLALRLTAMEEEGHGRIVSSPRITTLDNRTAKISQGVRIPISTVSAAGTNTTFVEANLELEVRPHVTNDGGVLMEIKTSKDEPDFAKAGANGDPTIRKKSAETEVLVRDGDTTVIGGIYTRTISDSSAGVPFLSRLPFVGWLFKKQRSEDKRAELLIFITPRIVNRDESLVKTSAYSRDAVENERVIGASFEVAGDVAGDVAD